MRRPVRPASRDPRRQRSATSAHRRPTPSGRVAAGGPCRAHPPPHDMDSARPSADSSGGASADAWPSARPLAYAPLRRRRRTRPPRLSNQCDRCAATVGAGHSWRRSASGCEGCAASKAPIAPRTSATRRVTSRALVELRPAEHHDGACGASGPPPAPPPPTPGGGGSFPQPQLQSRGRGGGGGVGGPWVNP